MQVYSDDDCNIDGIFMTSLIPPPALPPPTGAAGFGGSVAVCGRQNQTMNRRWISFFLKDYFNICHSGVNPGDVQSISYSSPPLGHNCNTEQLELNPVAWRCRPFQHLAAV